MTDRDVVYSRGGHAPTRGPVEAVYADTGALEVPCTSCGVAVNAWCVHKDGTLRKIPCNSRRPEVAS